MIDASIYREMGLNDSEFQKIVETLGREPSITEIGMYAVMWSEHCGYKYSRPVLRLFKKYAEAMDTGEVENAGVVDIGGGMGVVMKMESHNHPSAVEPFQGAATGVGGILRDIFTMGARPIANLNSLRFGPLADSRSRYLFERVVEGIAHYGNCVGVATVGGEIYFDPCYLGNPLVNAMSVGVVPLDKVASAAAEGVGNVVIYVGSATGRDGIHGATFASVELGPDSESKRPNVQIGDPFQEKLLIEATLEALASGAIVGIQDMGAAGLTCSTCETAAKASNGMEIDVRLVPTREGDMTPYEIMLSESQERMLAIAKREDADTVLNIFKKWGLSAAVVGTVTDTGRVEIKDNGVVVADIPAKSLTDECPTYYLDSHEPAYIKQVQFNAPGMLECESDLNGYLLKLLGSLSIASKRWVYQQYDHMVQTQTTVMPGDADAAVLRVRGTEKAIALTTDCNSRYCYLDPYVGSMHAVAEAARNLSCCGARPAAVTDCLNFPNPEKPDNFWVFRTCVQGLADACEKFGTPVISGNVSFYNETPAHAIFPTPTIGMIGVIDDPSLRMTMSFKDEGDVIYALGLGKPQLRGGELSYLLTGEAHGHPPVLDLNEELAVQTKLRDLIASGKVKSAHDASDGGIAVALAECAIKGKRGADVSLVESETDGVTTLYGERSATILITTAPDVDLPAEHKASGGGVSLMKLGTVGGDRLIFRTAAQETLDLPVAQMTDVFESAIPNAMAGMVTASETGL